MYKVTYGNIDWVRDSAYSTSLVKFTITIPESALASLCSNPKVIVLQVESV